MTHTKVLDNRTDDAGSVRQSGPVLVALKPFDGGESAIAMAGWLARRRHADLQAISVIEMGDPGTRVAGLPPLPEEFYQRERDEVASDLRARVASVADGKSTRVDVLEGPPESVVARAAAERGASMIVIGTGEHGRLGRFLYGERAVEVVRNAKGNVLIVPPYVDPPFQRAIAAVDFSLASVRAAAGALEMLDEGGRLTLVHVESASRRRGEPSRAAESESEQHIRSLFARFLQALPTSSNLTIESEILQGDAVGALLRYAEVQAVDLIACGRHRHSLVQRLFVGSVSTGLIRGAPCPVLVTAERPEDSDVNANLVFGQIRPSEDPAEWRELLHAVGDRNTGRRARLSLEAESPDGAESVDRGYVLLALDYDRRGARADIILGDPHAVGNHLTHRITGIRRLRTVMDPEGHDARVEFDTRSGMCRLDFVGT